MPVYSIIVKGQVREVHIVVASSPEDIGSLTDHEPAVRDVYAREVQSVTEVYPDLEEGDDEQVQ